MIYRHQIPPRIFQVLGLHIKGFKREKELGVKDALTNPYYLALVNLRAEDFWLENEIIYAVKYFLGNSRFEGSNDITFQQVYRESVEFLEFVSLYFEIVVHQSNVLLIPRGKV